MKNDPYDSRLCYTGRVDDELVWSSCLNTSLFAMATFSLVRVRMICRCVTAVEANIYFTKCNNTIKVCWDLRSLMIVLLQIL